MKLDHTIIPEVKLSVHDAPASSDMLQQSPENSQEMKEPCSDEDQSALHEQPSEDKSNEGVPPQQETKP